MRKLPWNDLRRAYEKDGLTCREISEKFGVGYLTVIRHAWEEQWGTPEQTTTPALARQLTDMVRQALQSEQQEGKPDIRRVKDLMGLLRELENLDKAQEDRRPDKTVVQVILPPEAEEWSR